MKTKTLRTKKTRKTKVAPRPVPVGATAVNETDILAWEHDPFAQAITGQAPVPATPIARPVPDLSAQALPITIAGTAPAAQRHQAGTREFRYWTAAEALRRGADFWASLVPAGTRWFSTVGQRLRVELDFGEDLNAFYTRRRLEFYHAAVAGVTLFSGESADVVSHELGHAVLDAIRPQLFDAASIEAAAFHESFGDMSAILVGLQLTSLRERVLMETQGRLSSSSRISRVAEQLGWAIRQRRADAVDPDCLRNAANSFFYVDPAKLPPIGPASMLTSAPHNFSRVFTGAFLDALAGVFTLQGAATEANLLAASHEAGKLLVQGILAAPLVPNYFSQVAAAMVSAAEARYRPGLSSAFVRHGILSLQAAAGLRGQAARGAGAAEATAPETELMGKLPQFALACSDYGLAEETLMVHAAAQPKRYEVAAAALDAGSVPPATYDNEARFFVEDLFRRGRISISSQAAAADMEHHPFDHPSAKKTHEVVKSERKLVLRRLRFDCGFDCD